MAPPRPGPAKKFFSVGEANSTLPLVRAIVRDITELAGQLRDRHERLARLRPGGRGALSEAHQEELKHAEEEFEQGRERMQELEEELQQLGVELKDHFSGLVDFPSLLDGRPVYLCWRLGEPEVGHWHELEAGFAGRQKLPEGSARAGRADKSNVDVRHL
jgi:hypothetical protein